MGHQEPGQGSKKLLRHIEEQGNLLPVPRYASFEYLLYIEHFSGVAFTEKQLKGTGNGERETGNRERGTGNGERGTGNGERGTGNREVRGRIFYGGAVAEEKRVLTRVGA